jgi:hypothetical protein
MDKTLIFGLFGHFHTEVNPEIIPNLSRRAAQSLRIESFYLKIFIKKNRINKYFRIKLLFLDSRWPAKTA